MLRTAEELAQLGGWELDLQTSEWAWTPGMFRLHGLDPQSEAPAVEQLLARIHADDRGRIEALLRGLAASSDLVGPEGLAGEYRALWADGSVHHLRFLGRVEDGRWVGTGQDVTAERIAERELQAHYAVSQALREWECF